MKQIAV